MARCEHLTTLIDQKVRDEGGTVRNPDKGPRYHLGASVIGRSCGRELWYSHRWATNARFEGRVLRLFDRGHEEESRFADWLELVGAKVMRYDPRTIYELWFYLAGDSYKVIEPGSYIDEYTKQVAYNVTYDQLHRQRARDKGYIVPEPKQFGFKGIMGHFGGSMDGKACHVPYQVEELGCSFDDFIVVEFKTHGEKSFTKLVADNSVQVSKPEHYAQTIIYIDEHKTPGGLYGAVNKNTDELYWEFIPPNPEFAETLRQKASTIIHSRQPPPRISTSPSWFVCKYCTHRPACHFGAPLTKSCRTCSNVLPVDGGRWYCQLFNRTIPEDFEPEGCDYWKQIND